MSSEDAIKMIPLVKDNPDDRELAQLAFKEANSNRSKSADFPGFIERCRDHD